MQVLSLPVFSFPQEEDGRILWAEVLGLLHLGVVRSRGPKTMGWRAGRRVLEGGTPTDRSKYNPEEGYSHVVRSSRHSLTGLQNPFLGTAPDF